MCVTVDRWDSLQRSAFAMRLLCLVLVSVGGTFAGH